MNHSVLWALFRPCFIVIVSIVVCSAQQSPEGKQKPIVLPEVKARLHMMVYSLKTDASGQPHLMIEDVVKNSPAEKAGIYRHLAIWGVGKTQFRRSGKSVRDFISEIEQTPLNEKNELILYLYEPELDIFNFPTRRMKRTPFKVVVPISTKEPEKKPIPHP